MPKKLPPTKFKKTTGSAGILDDYAVRKNVATREGTIEKVAVNDSDIINKKYFTTNYKLDDGTAIGQMCFWNGTTWTPTATSELFWDDTNKRLGIGTDIPNNILDINGAGQNNHPLRITASDVGNAILITGTGVLSSSANLINRAAAGDVRFQATKDIEFGTTSNIQMVLKTETGKVGIGTTTPDTKLQVVGDTKFGQDTTNYAGFKADGELELVGTARVYKNEWINVQGLKAPGTKPATAVDWGISCAWEFSDGTDDTICSSIRLPQDMDRTVAPEFKIGFASDTNTGDVVWQLEYLYLTPNEDTTAAAQETLTTTTTISGTADGLTIATITGMDLPSSTDQIIKIRIKRLGADGDDTLGDDCVMVGAGLKYVSDKLGIAL
jgi:hypothetical protein